MSTKTLVKICLTYFNCAYIIEFVAQRGLLGHTALHNESPSQFS